MAALLAATPDANVLPELVASSVSRGIAELDEVQADLDRHGDHLAAALLEAHRSVRTAVGAVRRGLKVIRSDHADVLGVYVYLPAGGSR